MLEAVHGRIEAALLDEDGALRALLDPPGERVAVLRDAADPSEDQVLEGAARELVLGVHGDWAWGWGRAGRTTRWTGRARPSEVERGQGAVLAAAASQRALPPALKAAAARARATPKSRSELPPESWPSNCGAAAANWVDESTGPSVW